MNNTIINKNSIRINCVSCTHNCKPTFAHPLIHMVKIHTHIHCLVSANHDLSVGAISIQHCRFYTALNLYSICALAGVFLTGFIIK